MYFLLCKVECCINFGKLFLNKKIKGKHGKIHTIIWIKEKTYLVDVKLL